MSDLIDRQAAIDALHMHLMYRMGTDSNKKRLDEWINNLPSVQPEIIRCKDCKHYLHDEEYGFDWCNRMSGVFRAKPDGFCSWADMRGGEME